MDENIHKSGLTSSNTTEAEFYDSNVIYSEFNTVSLLTAAGVLTQCVMFFCAKTRVC